MDCISVNVGVLMLFLILSMCITCCAEEYEETTETLGDLLIKIRVKSGGSGTSREILYRLFGENTVQAHPVGAPCKNDDLTLTDIADIGRLCTISLEAKMPSNCFIEKFEIFDKVRNTNTVFEVKNRLTQTETVYSRSDKIKVEWKQWTEWENCNCSSNTKTRRRTCPEMAGQCKDVRECLGNSTETGDCTCKGVTDEVSEDGPPVLIPIIACIAVVLLVIVIAAICYSRRMNKRREKEAANKLQISNPIIVVSPPEESDDECEQRLIDRDLRSATEKSGHCELVKPEVYKDSDVKGPPADMIWEENVVYQSSGAR